MKKRLRPRKSRAPEPVPAEKPECHLHVWYYPEHRFGWHLNANTPACHTIACQIDDLLADPKTTPLQLPTTIPERVQFASVEREFVAELMLHYPGGEVADSYWKLKLQKGNVLSLTVGAAKLRDIKESLLGLPHWKDDFALGPEVDWHRRPGKSWDRNRWDRECLWFWTKM